MNDVSMTNTNIAMASRMPSRGVPVASSAMRPRHISPVFGNYPGETPVARNELVGMLQGAGAVGRQRSRRLAYKHFGGRPTVYMLLGAVGPSLPLMTQRAT